MKPPAGLLYGELVIAPPGRGLYAFPFLLLDETPGGENLGRIEWHVEPVPGKTPRGRRGESALGGFLVWATQTTDPRYRARTYWLERDTGGLEGRRLTGAPGAAFIENVWIIRRCREHNRLVLSAYPRDHHRRLVFELTSSIAVVAEFRP